MPPLTATQREYQRRYYTENKERIKARVRAWRVANPQARKAQDARYRVANRDKAVAATRRWQQGHPEEARRYAAERRAAKRALPYERVDLGLVFRRDEGLCGICGEAVDPSDWHLDHVVPLAKGGHHVYENVQVAHPTCNRRKWTR